MILRKPHSYMQKNEGRNLQYRQTALSRTEDLNMRCKTIQGLERYRGKALWNGAWQEWQELLKHTKSTIPQLIFRAYE
jgi:hypothetical protein